jgi:CRP-like cAMP-binding protein
MEARVRLVSPLERALYLKSLAPLKELSSEELALVGQHTKEQFFRKGAEIFKSGEPLESFHIVVEGQVRARGGEHGDSVVGPSAALGFLSLLSQSEEGLEAVAEADTVTLEIDADDLYDVLEDHFSIFLTQLQSVSRVILNERKKIADGTYLAPAEGVLELPDRQLDLVERLLLIRRGAGFDRTNIDAMIQVVRSGTELGVKAGTKLWKPGDPPGHFYIIVSGTIRCILDEGKRHFRAGPGYPVGNIESLAGEPRWYEAVTETNVVALRSETDTFLDVLEDHSELGKGFLATMASGAIQVIEQRRRAGQEDSVA